MYRLLTKYTARSFSLKKRPRPSWHPHPNRLFPIAAPFSSSSTKDPEDDPTTTTPPTREQLLDRLPLHKEEDPVLATTTPGSNNNQDPLPPDTARPHGGGGGGGVGDFPVPKPMTDWGMMSLYDFDSKKDDSEQRLTLEEARAEFEKLQRQNSNMSTDGKRMAADEIAEYDAIEKKEKAQLEAAFLKQPELSYKAVTRALLGNVFITVLKFGVYLRTGSAAMLSEAIHTLVDSGNQAILLVGIRQMSNSSDKRHPYGYGRAAYFWGLVSALGMFWVGSGVSFIHGINELVHPPDVLIQPGWETWTTLGISFGVDGYVLYKTVADMKRSVPDGMSFYDFTKKIRDPFVMAVLLEDMAATTGVLIAVGGIGLTYYTGLPYFDALASCGVGVTLGMVAVYLARMNQRFLLGYSIDSHIVQDIRSIILNRPSIEAVHSIQTQWLGPSAFSFKAEVDFDGTYPAARLMTNYAPMFHDMQMENTMDEELPVVLGWYAEDVTRILETEVKEVEADIRAKYPEAGKRRDVVGGWGGVSRLLTRFCCCLVVVWFVVCVVVVFVFEAYIELEPDSKDHRVRMGSGNTRGGKDWEQEREDIARMAQMVRLRRVLEDHGRQGNSKKKK